MLGPDLDIHSIQYKRWGPMRWIWLPYQRALKHRSRLSHGPIIGTALRVVYLAAWIALFAVILVFALNLLWDAQLAWQPLKAMFSYMLKRYRTEWLTLLLGLELGAISHFTSDILGSRIARYRSARQKAGHKKVGHQKSARQKRERQKLKKKKKRRF